MRAGKWRAAAKYIHAMSLAVRLLGTSASRPTVERNVASIALVREGETLLFDCGEGTQRQMMRYGVGFSFREIFFTHYHADHMLGVTGLLRTLGLQERSQPVRLFGPRGAQRILGAAISLGIERNRFPVEVVEIKPGDRLVRDQYDIVVFETEHRADTLGFTLLEHPRLGRFNPERARELGIPEGPLWGRLHKGETVTLEDGRSFSPADLVGAPRRGRSLVYTGDTRPSLAVVEAAKAADLLIHEATFGGDELARAKETGHSTAAEAARVALEAGARRLVLTHISSRYNRDTSELLAEAKAVFPETVIARDGMTIEVPYSDPE
jgi:ribonuclease Z